MLLTAPDGTVRRRVSTFGTMTADLLALADWLGGSGVTHIAMESTGVYWRPVYNLLEEDGRTILLVHPQHMKAVPGRKTDVRDSEWIADLLRHGLLQGSFIPPAPIRALPGAPWADDALPEGAGSPARRRGQPRAEAAGGGERQARLGRDRCPRGERPRDARRPARRTGGSRGAGGRPLGTWRAGGCARRRSRAGSRSTTASCSRSC